MIKVFSKIAFVALLLVASLIEVKASPVTLLNASYDPTREFYREYNELFAAHWQKTEKQTVNVRQSHGGSGSQARSVIDGLDADIVTLALAYDIDALRQRAQLIPEKWQERLPHNSSPYLSTIVLLVRKGNPKNIKDWDDLLRPDVKVITPNPKTSGGARWNYLAAWGYALEKFGGDQKKAFEFVKTIYSNVPVLDPAARGATNTFVQRGIGDVFMSWENEAFLAVEKLAPGQFEIIVPSVSILAEPPVAVVDTNVDRKGTRKIAEAYLKHLYSDKAQHLAAKHFYRPSNPEIAKQYEDSFPKAKLVKIEELFGGWEKAQTDHFSDDGYFDQILKAIAKAR